VCDKLGQDRPSRGAQDLETRELELDGDAGVGRRVDQGQAVGQNGGGGGVGCGAGAPIQAGCRPQRGGIGVETENDL
jgi:hypothetical protein